MKGNETNVEVKLDHKQLAEILPVGFKTKLVNILHDEDVFRKVVKRDGNGKIVRDKFDKPVMVDLLVHSKGDFRGFTFKGANGKTYTDYNIRAAIGYANINTIFKKLT